ncbi:MAG: glycerophosphodiester phosphodiesterase [Isosphaeraceae bacterium]
MRNGFLERLLSRSGRPLVIAHRGDSFHAPENSLEAARLGWEAGADAWELDVQLARDGVAVIFHDDVLTRTTDVAVRFQGDPRGDVGFRLSDFDWSELRNLDAGAWFVEEGGSSRSARALGTLHDMPPTRRELYRSGRVRIPTLRDALALTADLDWLVNIEIKSFPDRPDGLIEAVLATIAETGTASRVLLSSFDHRDLARIADRVASGPGELEAIPRGILVSTPLYRPHAYLREIVGARTLHASAEILGSESIDYRRRPSPRALAVAEVADLKAAGVPVLVYTVNDHHPGGLAEHLAEIGVDALFTDDPEGLKARFDDRYVRSATA